MARDPSLRPTLITLAICAALAITFGWFDARSRRRHARPPAPPPSSSPIAAPSETPVALPPPPTAVRLIPATSALDDSLANGLVEGRVVSRGSGRGCAGATLTFLRDGSTRAVTTDASGAFRFVPDAVGAWGLLAVTAPGHLAAGGDGRGPLLALEARAGVAVRGVVIPLTEAVAYEGRVVSPDGAPVAGASVSALDGSGMWTSAADGRFTFQSPDGVTLQARHRAWGAAYGAVDLAVQASRRLTLRLAPPAADRALRELRGLVTDADNAPLEGALVTAVLRGPAGQEPPRWSAVTAADGRFAFEGVPEGRFVVRATHESHEPAVEEAAAGEGVILTMRAGRTLTGTVMDGRTGYPATSFTVIVAALDGIAHVGAPVVLPVVDGRGRFAVRNLAEGPHQVRAVAAGRAPSDEVIVRVTNEPTDVSLRLTVGGVIDGVVRDRTTGAPVADARVSLEGRVAVADLPVDLLASATTDARGRFELAGVSRGLRSVFVAAAGYHARILSGLVIEEGRSAEGLVVDLAAVEDGGTPAIELAGVGAVLSARGEVMVVERVVPGGGAAEAGMREGDEVHAVDGAPVRTLGFEGTIQRIRGPEGSAVRLGVRSGDAGVRELVVTRRRIRA